jgi:hypothetical protein
MARRTPESIFREIWYGSRGLHLIGAPIHVKIDLVALDQLFWTRQRTQQLCHKEGSNFLDQSSLVKHSGAADEVWYHGYLTDWTQKEG